MRTHTYMYTRTHMCKHTHTHTNACTHMHKQHSSPPGSCYSPTHYRASALDGNVTESVSTYNCGGSCRLQINISSDQFQPNSTYAISFMSCNVEIDFCRELSPFQISKYTHNDYMCMYVHVYVTQGDLLFCSVHVCEWRWPINIALFYCPW